jgi:hypothetical protein
MKTTGVKTEYERGDIVCFSCKRNGPSRYTSHTFCTACKLCGMCCVRHGGRCGASLDVANCSAPSEELRERLAATLLEEFYKWQRGIMKPF